MTNEFLDFLKNYGVVAVLFGFCILEFFKYLKESRVAGTLKDANDERKEGTDEVAEKLDNQQDVCLAEMKKDIEYIKLQVSNHIPTVMKEINDKLDEHIKNQIEFEKDVLVKIARI